MSLTDTLSFIEIDNDKYVLNFTDLSPRTSRDNKSYSIAFYTPTYFYTYPNGKPEDFRSIKKIDFTKSFVTFTKDLNENKCCIDICDEQKNKNKCRIIGLNGKTIIGKSFLPFEVYEVSKEAHSFADNKPRLIYISYYGLYIVSKDNNSLQTVKFCPKLTFKGEVIEISAINGQRTISGFDKSTHIFNYNCPRDEPVQFEVEFSPIMKQIEKIAGIKITIPPSDQEALHRMAEILDIPVELLTIYKKKICIVNTLNYKDNNFSDFSVMENTNYKDDSFSDFSVMENTNYKDNNFYNFSVMENTRNLWNNYKNKLENYIPIINTNEAKLNQDTEIKAFLALSELKENYFVPLENDRKKIALKPWPKIDNNIYAPFMKQIENITGVKPNTPPPNKEVAIKLISEILNIPKELLIMLYGKVYLINMDHNKVKYWFDSDEEEKCENWKLYVDRFKSYIPVVLLEDYPFNFNFLQVILSFEVHDFDNSYKAKEKRKQMVLTPWNDIEKML